MILRGGDIGVDNGQQSAALHASLMTFFVISDHPLLAKSPPWSPSTKLGPDFKEVEDASPTTHWICMHIFFICIFQLLAVQNSSISDLVTHGTFTFDKQRVTPETFDQNDEET